MLQLNGHPKNCRGLRFEPLRCGEPIEFGLGRAGVGIVELPGAAVEVGVDRQPDDWRGKVGSRVNSAGNVRGGERVQGKAAVGAESGL